MTDTTTAYTLRVGRDARQYFEATLPDDMSLQDVIDGCGSKGFTGPELDWRPVDTVSFDAVETYEILDADGAVIWEDT